MAYRRARRGNFVVYLWPEASTLTIQPMPNRSSTMPKRGDQKVLFNGISTLPPAERAAKARSASASLATERAREKPSNLGLSVEQPSEAMIVVWPILKLVCMILFSNPGGTL